MTYFNHFYEIEEYFTGNLKLLIDGGSLPFIFGKIKHPKIIQPIAEKIWKEKGAEYFSIFEILNSIDKMNCND